MCNAWKDWRVKNLKTENFPISIGWTSIKYQSRKVESFEHKSSHFRSVEGDLRLAKTIKNFKTLKSGNFMQKNNLKGVFITKCRWTWPRIVLKTWCLLNENIKTNQEVKITRFKLLKPENLIFLQIFNQNQNLHSHIKSYTIKDSQISQHTIICIEFSKDLCVVCATSMCMRYIKGDM